MVHETVDPDGNVVLRWGSDGAEYVVAADATDEDRRIAYRKAVAHGLAKGDMVEDEVDRSVAREIQGRFGIRKDANGGLILAWWPSPEEAEAIAALVPDVPGAVPTNDLHLTLLYLAESGWEEGDPREGGWDLQLLGAVVKLFARRWSPCECKIGGLGRFVMEEDSDAVVLLVDCPDLANLRRCLEDDLICHGAVPHTSALFDVRRHGWIPHITIAYVPKTTSSIPALTEAVKFTVDNVTLAAGDARVRFQLDDYWSEYAEGDKEPRPLVQMAKDAFALGKAGRVLSGKNLGALKDAITAMQSVVDAEEKRRREEDDEYKEKRKAVLEEKFGEIDPEITYTVTKAVDEKRFTLGPLYAPNRKDAHGEYTDADSLQMAVWEWVRQSAAAGRAINLQHGDHGDVTVGEWVEVMAWPVDHTIKVRKAGGEEREIEMPAGTVYVGAIWHEDSWPYVKSGKLNGWSLGGKAVRVDEGMALADMAPMGDAGIAKERMELIKVAAEAEAALRDRELDAARTNADRWESAVARMIDAVSKFASRHEPDLHVHLPEQSVKVNVENPDFGLTDDLEPPEE